MWSYFFDQNQLEFQRFHTLALKENFLVDYIPDAFNFIRHHHSKLNPTNPNAHILLLVDELHKFAGTKFPLTEPIQDQGADLLSQLCWTMSDERNHIIVSSLDQSLVSETITTSGRSIDWVPLEALNETESFNVLKNIDRPIPLLRKCSHGSGGHARSLEALSHALQTSKSSAQWRKPDIFYIIMKSACSKIVGSITPTKTMIAAGLVGDRIPLDTKINGRKFSELIAHAIYMHNYQLSSGCKFVPRVPPLLLLSTVEANGGENCKFWETLIHEVFYNMIDKRSDSALHQGDRFEKFHYYFESLKQLARVECRDIAYEHSWKVVNANKSKDIIFIHSTIAEHYHLINHHKSHWLAALKNQPFQEVIEGTNVFNSKLQWPVSISYFDKELSSFEEFENYIKRISSPSMLKCSRSFPGIDAIIICRDATTKQLWFLFLEMKYSLIIPAATARMIIVSKLNLQRKYIKCLRSQNSAFHIISVFVMWRKMESAQIFNWNPYPNIRVYESQATTNQAHFFPQWVPNPFSYLRSKPPKDDCHPDGILVLGHQQLSKFYSSLTPFSDLDNELDDLSISSSSSSSNLYVILICQYFIWQKSQFGSFILNISFVLCSYKIFV